MPIGVRGRPGHPARCSAMVGPLRSNRSRVCAGLRRSFPPAPVAYPCPGCRLDFGRHRLQRSTAGSGRSDRRRAANRFCPAGSADPPATLFSVSRPEQAGRRPAARPSRVGTRSCRLGHSGRGPSPARRKPAAQAVDQPGGRRLDAARRAAAGGSRPPGAAAMDRTGRPLARRVGRRSALGLPADSVPGGSHSRPGTKCPDADRRVHSAGTRSGATRTQRAARSCTPDSPGVTGADRVAADARGRRGVRARHRAGRVRESRRPPAGFRPLRRAVGRAVAGLGALRRQQRLPGRPTARQLGLSRLGGAGF